MAGELEALSAAAPTGLPTATADAFELAVRALRYFAVDAREQVRVAEIDRVTGGDEDARSLAALAAGRMARAAFLRFDANELAVWIDLLASLDVAAATAPLAASQGWSAALAGNAAQIRESAETLKREASARSWPNEVIEATVLKALGASIEGDSPEAIRLARQASRMSRTESLPQEEYLANLVLARLRRLDGKPHLSARILSALLRVATPPWHPWMCWELLLAGVGPEVSTPAADALTAALHAASAGDEATMNTNLAAAERCVEGFHSLSKDLEVLRALLRGNHESFSVGKAHQVPRGLGALALLPGEDRDAAYVLADPSVVRRVLAPGLALRQHPLLPPAKQRQARTETAIATLLLAGPEGMPEDIFFADVYGFAFQERHRNVRNVLYHRVRERLGEAANLTRGEGRVAIKAVRPLAAPDPRCSPPPEHSLLLVLAARGFASPRDAADALGIPMRTVQDALKRLAADGACRTVKKGRKLEYHLEDTTFLEPTRV